MRKTLLLLAVGLAGCGQRTVKQDCYIRQQVSYRYGAWEVYTKTSVMCPYEFHRFAECELSKLDSVRKAEYLWASDIKAVLDSVNTVRSE